ncbi:MAG TPA: zinc ribbon domain-containing protein [Bacilli bacterium]|nr:zinc ribbon domain-containing protein [Bacilli bacterium]
MSKELEALKSIKGTIISSRMGDWGFEYRYLSDIESTKKHFDIIEQALKRNEPVKLLKEKKYLHEFEWYTVFGKCPLCKHYNPSTANYCGNCGQALEKFDWSDE